MNTNNDLKAEHPHWWGPFLWRLGLKWDRVFLEQWQTNSFLRSAPQCAMATVWASAAHVGLVESDSQGMELPWRKAGGVTPSHPLKWRPPQGKVVCGTTWPHLYHRKVSMEELPPGVSGLTSTLTQATFSWLHRRGRRQRRQDSDKMRRLHTHGTDSNFCEVREQQLDNTSGPPEVRDVHVETAHSNSDGVKLVQIITRYRSRVHVKS